MTDTDDYEKLRQAINERLEPLGFEPIKDLEIIISEGQDPRIAFSLNVSKTALLSAEEREMLTSFENIVSGLQLDEKLDKKQGEIEDGGFESWDI